MAKGYIEQRPWGQYEILDEFQVTDGSGNDVAVKRHNMKPGGSFSYQSHKLRSEYWMLVQGEGKAIVDGVEKPMKPGDTAFVPVGAKHRFINTSQTQEAVIIEVMTGHYDEEDNTRYEDNYGRVQS